MSYSPRNPNGQDTMSDSSPVVIASDQSAIPVSATNLDIRDLTFAADKVDASGTVLGAGNNNIGDVDIASIAAGDNNIGNVDVVTLPSIPAGNNNIGDVDVASLPALATGDNVIGRVKLTDGTDVADILDLANSNPLTVAIVDSSGDQITSFGGGTQYTEDAAAAANPVGNALIVVRNDSRTGTLTSTDGDNIALRGTDFGELYVKHWDAVNVQGFEGGAPIEVFGAVSIVDGSTIADVLDLTNSNPLTVAIVDSNGDQITSFGGGTQYTQGDTDASITGTAMLMEGAGDTLLPVQGTVADGLLVNLGSNNDVTISGTVATELTDMMATDGSAALTRLLQVGGTDGTNAQILSTNASGHLNIADGGNTITVDGTVSVTDGLDIEGTLAHDDADSTSKPVKVGGRAIAHGTNPTAVAADDRTNWYFNRHGIPFVLGGHPNTITRVVEINDADGAQTNASMVGTINAGTKVVVTGITVTCDHANTNATAVKVGFGAATLPADSATGANGILLCHNGIAPGSGIVMGNGGGILGIGADGEELRLTCEDPAGGSVCIQFTYFTIES